MATLKALPGPGRSADNRKAIAAQEAPTIAIIDNLRDFLALRDEWDALFSRAALPQQVFQSHVVLRHWATHYLDAQTRLSIVTMRREGRLVMIWPLIRQRRFGVDTLRFMGIPIAQFGDVLVEPGDGAQALLQAGWKAVRSLGGDIFEARKLRADSALALSGVLGGAVERDRLAAPLADLAFRVGQDGPSQAYRPRERSNHRRRLRRLTERGPISFSCVWPGPEASALVEQAVAMKQATLQRHGIIAPTISDPRFMAFFRDLAGDDAGGSPLRIALICCADKPVGIDLALDCKGTSFGHVIATNPDHERGGLGGILIHHSFASAKDRGNAIFDLLAPADPYKLEHADGQTGVSDLALPLSLKGRIACSLGLAKLRPALKATLKRLPAPVTRRIAAWAASGKA
jgi:CelD/BcsL family acetyltransferase involved in cellulose biosynthesis